MSQHTESSRHPPSTFREQSRQIQKASEEKRSVFLHLLYFRDYRTAPSCAWQRPTLTGAHAPTTIGAEKLNFRVRYGNGCDLLALITRLFTRHYFIIMSFSYFAREIFFIFSKLDNVEETL